jgi:diguanylate cyclase (GGDEF)-like protein
MTNPFRRESTWFAIGACVVLTGAWLSFHSITQMVGAYRLVQHTLEAARSLEAAYLAVREAGSSEREFVLTGSDSVALVFARAAAKARRETALIVDSTTDNPAQQARAAQLHNRVEQGLGTDARIIAIRRSSGQLAAEVEAGRGHPAQETEAVRSLVEVMVGEEERLLQKQTEEREAGVSAVRRSLIALSALSLLILAMTVLLRRRDTMRREAAERAQREAQGQLAASLAELHERSAEQAELTRTDQALQLCLTPEEAYRVIASCIQRAYPQSSGAVGVIHPSRSVVELKQAWGETPPAAQTFAPEECVALRGGRAYGTLLASGGLRCAHVAAETPGWQVCVPLAAHGQTLGLLHLGGPEALDQRHAKLGRLESLLRMSEHFAIAIANLQLRETLRHQTLRDPLTGSFNRRYLEASLERELARAARHQEPLSVLMLDLDHFKRFNDTHGHEAGDLMLQSTAEALRTSVRAEDMVCRYGGEEFTIILPGSPREAALERAEMLRERVSQIVISCSGQPVRGAGVSIGLAVFPEHGSDTQGLLRAADKALYEAKRAGRNRVSVVT